MSGRQKRKLLFYCHVFHTMNILSADELEAYKQLWTGNKRQTGEID
ncbi:MAG TPA: hypothetical protein VEY51_09105 [Chondromyces sp.]|nr:hypothetical protein [Chondromyces sp.]